MWLQLKEIVTKTDGVVTKMKNGKIAGRPIREENADPYYPVSAEAIGINFARKHGIDCSDAQALTKLRSLTVADRSYIHRPRPHSRW